MRLGLGTAQFGLDYGVSNRNGRTPVDEVHAILDCAARNGVTLLDTAPAYGDAEAILAGAGASERGFRVVTKTLSVSRGVDAVVEAVRHSADKLGSPLYTVLVHAAGDLLQPDGPALWTALQGLKSEGVARRVGLSVYPSDPLLELAARFPPDVVQLPASVFDPRFFRDGTIDRLAAAGIEVHARSILHQGLVYADTATLPHTLQPKRAEIERWQAHVAASGVSPLQLALSFIAAQPGIHTAIVGVTRCAELQGILDVLREPWPGGEAETFALTDPLLLTPTQW